MFLILTSFDAVVPGVVYTDADSKNMADEFVPLIGYRAGSITPFLPHA
jgi:hypothetical protein